MDVCNVVGCIQCESEERLVENHGALCCESCGASFLISENIVKCVASIGSLTPLAGEWNEFYEKNIKPYSAETDWWRLSCWRTHLFEHVVGDLAEKLVVDLGCGTASRVAAITPLRSHAYRYIGIDSSMDALQHARLALPGGLFIHADLDSLRLHPEQADVVLCLGVLMYFSDFTKPLNKVLHALKHGGILLLHEQVLRQSWGQMAASIFKSSRHIYPFSQGIPLEGLKENLVKYGSIVHIHLTGSPWRTLFMKMCDGTFLQPLRPYAAWLDSLLCATVGRIFPVLGASEAQIVFQKA